MPRTHFLAGVVAVQLLAVFGVPVNLWDLLLGGFLAMLVDADHIFVYWWRHRNFDFLKMEHDAVSGIEEMRSWVHEWNGLMFFLGISIVMAYFNKHYSLIFLTATWSHLLLDHENFRYLHRKFIKMGHFVYPVSWGELNLDMFFIAMIVILAVL